MSFRFYIKAFNLQKIIENHAIGILYTLQEYVTIEKAKDLNKKFL